LIIALSIDEREPYLAVVDAQDVIASLVPVSKFAQAAERAVDSSRRVWQALTMGLDDWVFSQTNRALHSWVDVEYAQSATLRARLPVHPDRSKAWDNLLALVHTVRTTEFSAPILDAGAGRESAYLPSLRALSYADLTGINLLERTAETVDGIRYQYGDITGTDFPPQHFGFVACLSVLEHGVDWQVFLREMVRILVDGGHLFVSVDYWPDPIDTGTRVWFGVPVKIFTATEISEFVSFASGLGLQLVGDLDSGCKRASLKNDGLEYTFLNLLFVRKTNTSPI
jgi:SAM-dependent methyltransferase